MDAWPNSFAWSHEVEAWSPISRIAEQVVVDYADFNPLDRKTNRLRKARNKQQAMYKRQIFVDDGDQEAGLVLLTVTLCSVQFRDTLHRVTFSSALHISEKATSTNKATWP